MKYLSYLVGALFLTLSIGSCTDDEVLESMEIDSVIIKEIPTQNQSGENWDADGTDPDIYFVIKVDSRTVYTSHVLNDTIPSPQLEYTQGFPISVEDTRANVTIALIDKDDTEEDQNSDLIGEVRFVPDFYSDDESINQIKELEDINVEVLTRWNYK